MTRTPILRPCTLLWVCLMLPLSTWGQSGRTKNPGAIRDSVNHDSHGVRQSSLYHSVDSRRVLPLIQVWERRPEARKSVGLMSTGDSLQQRMQPGSDVGRDLQWSSPLAIHSRGPGQLSTLAAGGLPTTHLMVTWEGMSLVNPMNQTPDLGLMPSWLTTGAQLEARAAGGRISGGSGGGVLWIPGEGQWGASPASLFVTTGSFGARSGGIGTTLHRGTFTYRMRAYAQHWDLDFPYPTTSAPDAPIARRSHAAQSGTGLREQLGFQLGEHYFRLGHWVQMHCRQLPAALTAAQSRAEQGDTLHRVSLNWSHAHGRHLFWGNAGWSRDDNHYRDSSTQVYGWHRVEGLQAWLGWRRDWSNCWLNSHLQLQNHRVRSSAYTTGVHQSRLALQSLFGRQWGRHTVNFAVRIEQVDGRWLTPVPEISWSAPTLVGKVQESALSRPESLNLLALVQNNETGEDDKRINTSPSATDSTLSFSGTWSASLSGLQRIPGLNDLYWQPGGRPDLGNELGWSAQVGRSITLSKPHQPTLLQINTRLFMNYLKHQIVWLPDAEAGYWRPTALQETRSGGLHLDARARQSIRKSILEAQLQYAFTRSSQMPDSRPLPYLPPHVMLTALRVMHPKRFVDLRLRVVDRRPDVFDPNDTRLRPYTTLRLGAGWRLPGKAQRWHLSTTVDNLLNTRYELVPYHPMPGRQLNFTIMFE
ncbi:MAG: TonB-dependent receptor [Sphingomonadales bacterium]|nr:TonB-dependent receptor [Sphingomonadales bacterium]